MICMSLNVCGVMGSLNFLASKRLLKSHALEIILLEETMCVRSKAVEALSPWLKDWSFCSLGLDDLSGGLLIV
jgi:hypothetical protein